MSTALARSGAGTGLAPLIFENADRLAAALPQHFTAEKMAALMSVLVYRTPKLRECDPESVVTSLIQVGTLDLDLTPGRNEAHLIPRWNKNTRSMECTFMPGYKGLERLAVRTGVVRYIEPCEVRRGDAFRVRRTNDNTEIEHEPAYTAGRGEITHAYTVAHMYDGKITVEVMSADEIEEIHRRSEGYRKAIQDQREETGPWVSDWKEMALKTVVKRHTKRFPRPTDPDKARAFDQLQAAIEADNSEYQSALDATPEHHASQLENNTGHGRTGAYAPPEAVEEYRAWLTSWVNRINAAWLDRVTGRLDPADVPKWAGELISTFQMSGHVLKWARDAGMIQAPDGPKMRQYDPLAAVAWMRDKAAVKAEAKRYCESLFAAKWDKLFPEVVEGPAPEDESQAPPVEPEDVPQEEGDDPDVDIPF